MEDIGEEKVNMRSLDPKILRNEIDSKWESAFAFNNRGSR